jgi:uncharacterized protein with von Willebrand factor type A (vWA) domain
MNTIFEANSLERNYRFLDELPESLYPVVVTHTQGLLPQRVQGIMAWRKALLAGYLPNDKPIDWPNQPALGKILSVLGQLDIARFCQQQAELTDHLLLEICEAVSQFETIQSEQFNKHFEELKQLEEQRKREHIRQNNLRKQSASQKSVKDFKQLKVLSDDQLNEQQSDTPISPIVLDTETLEQLQKEALRLAGENAADLTTEQFLQDWQERARVWHELAQVFGELAGLLGRGWDLSQGLLKSQGWLEMVRLRQLLEQIPQLKKLIRTLGKMQISTAEESMPVMEQLFEPVKRLFEEIKDIQTPLAPMETRGITRSDDISRMLPSELVFLGHPQLKMLWHARRAEKALLTYRVEGVLSEHVITEKEVLESQQQPGKKERLERGPIIVCLDTSGSMHGTPEMVAKALTLEAMRVAHKEKRACYLYAFSGPQQIIEHQLELTEQGLTEFMAFLIQSFHGGTDIQAPLEKAVAKLATEEWKRADIMIVTDGEFSVPSNIVEMIHKAKEKDKLRVHGVLVGSFHSSAIEKLCNPVHRFSDWQAF